MKLDNPVYYNTGHTLNERMYAPFASGFGAMRSPATEPLRLGHTSIFYGILRGCGDRLLDCERLGEDYLYCDHGYFSQVRTGPDQSYFKGYFRVVPNSRYYTAPPMQYDIDGWHETSPDRFNALGIDVKPWRKGGDYVLVAPPSKYVAALEGLNTQAWLEMVVEKIRQVIDLPVVLKPKDGEMPMVEALSRAYALVTMASNAAIDALVEGVPVFTSPAAAAGGCAFHDLNQLPDAQELAPQWDRRGLFADLAYQQFTYSEIADGTALSILQDRFGDTPCATLKHTD